ncbi:MAG: TetR/AcrR family transcriptional regulator [Caulobacteraceae bacterium]|nr:TetR/AcrR family transcriptional regulator [Caulobacteraceae bacterium]
MSTTAPHTAPPTDARLSRRQQPNPPKRAGAQARVDAILDAADALVASRPLETVSLPLIAQAAGAPPSSLYHFFPSTEAVLIALVRRYNDKLDSLLEETLQVIPPDSWQAMLRVLTARARAFHDQHPVYTRLILRTAAFSSLRQTDDEHITQMGRRMLQVLNAHFHMPDAPDLDLRLSVAIALSDRIWALFPDSDGMISDFSFEESQRAMIAYLSNYLPPLMAPREAAK